MAEPGCIPPVCLKTESVCGIRHELRPRRATSSRIIATSMSASLVWTLRSSSRLHDVWAYRKGPWIEYLPIHVIT
jgi:hypothetical protein